VHGRRPSVLAPLLTQTDWSNIKDILGGIGWFIILLIFIIGFLLD
jgi:hypothetical protein